MSSTGLGTSFRLDMYSGPYQDNGASPWYAPLNVGTSATPQVQFFALDTGTNMDWVTSTLCTTDACVAHKRFDPSLSSTFQPDPSGQTVDLDYGPWGTLQAKIGTDVINLPGASGSVALGATFGLATNYSGTEFQEIDWSACIALPAQGAMQQGFTNVMAELFAQGYVYPGRGYVCFDWNTATRTGSCLIGDVDLSGVDPSQYIVLPFDDYKPLSSVDYIWTTAGATVTVGDLTLDDMFFCLDSGSSCFKGDKPDMYAILTNLGNNQNTLTIRVGEARGVPQGTLTVPPEIYMRTYEAGEYQGETLPQFDVLGDTPQLLLVGSVLMDHLYTIYVYEPGPGGVPQGAGVIIFNKLGGPKIIDNPNAEAIQDAEHLREVFDAVRAGRAAK